MIVTRFAPSPTGDLHIGSARTALYCWLWAKNQRGKFILRIEDTDRERSTQAAVNVILEGLTWLGLKWDEGPIYQTQRFDRYKAVAETLVKKGDVYPCYCSKERLEKLREEQMAAKQKPRYDGHCRNRDPHTHPEGPFVLRFKTPQTGTIQFKDMVKGEIVIQNNELDDLILVRSDGTPTYNFTVVVDDWDMGITHVLRGDDHINNTPRQIHILNALGASIPEYGHMPMLLGPDGKKLSKRTGAASVLEFQKEGILPQALINYIVRLGWSHGDQEIFTLEEMIQYFDVHAINASSAAMNPEKLLWLNQHYLKTLPEEEVAAHLLPFLEIEKISLENGPPLKEVVVALRERSKTLVEMAQKSRFFYEAPLEISPELAKKHLTANDIQALMALNESLSHLSSWTKESIQETMNALVEKLGIKFGLIAQPVRVAITGTTVSPPIDVSLQLLGKEQTLKRLQHTITKFSP